MKRRRIAAFLVCVLCCGVRAADLGQFTVREPLGLDWADEWLLEEVDIQVPPGGVRSEQLRLLNERGDVLPAQFYFQRRALPDLTTLSQPGRLGVFFKTSLPRGQNAPFRITDQGGARAAEIEVIERDGKTVIRNGIYELEFDSRTPLPINAMRSGSVKDTLGSFHWPSSVRVTNVTERFSDRGPARVIFRREFQFADPGHYCNYRFEVRAGDPWLGIQDSFNLGDGAAMQLDLRKLDAKVVWHPHTFSARTLKPNGTEEDSTLEPPQLPIATLAPAWRENWYGGGPFAFVYRPDADHGLGIAAVQAGGWNCRIDITMESQSLEIHGDREREGQVSVRLPMEGAHRNWALIFGPPETRHKLPQLTRSHSDLPLDRVLRRWKLDWASSAPEFKAPAANELLKANFNRPALNPMTYPRQVLQQIDEALKQKRVKSRDLAVLAYIFSGTDYWPGADEAWNTANPSLHAEMTSIPLRVALLMPDHPDARQWVHHGVRETHLNVMAESWPGGAWSESMGRSHYFFEVARNIALLRDYGVTNGFQAWPRLKEVASYLAAMHTPEDPRYGSRQRAPIGDAAPGNYLNELRGFAENYRQIDPAFVETLVKNAKGGSREFKGFGALLRGDQSFVTLKAGPARYHYQGDELSFYFSALGAPVAIDYACGDSPRPWSVAIHNRPDLNGKTPQAVAEPRAFYASPVADVFVADERATNISAVPMEPHLATKPASLYPTARLGQAGAWKMRRYAMLVKHDPQSSKIPDYLVIRDEIIAPESVGWNLHVLGRDIKGDGPAFEFPGQLGVDLSAHFLEPKLSKVEKREWGWSGPANARREASGVEYEQEHLGKLIPENFQRGSWKPDDGEHARWLRAIGNSGSTQWLVVLAPRGKDQPAMNVERLSATSARVTLGAESEVIHLGTDATYQAAVERGGKPSVLMPARQLKPLNEITFAAPKLTRGRQPNL